jgi:hypothetical protein
MTAVTISSTRGTTYDVPINYTIETSAPTSDFDFELRYNLLDQNGNAINKLDLIKFLKAVIAGVNSGGNNPFFSLAESGSNYVAATI